MKLQTAFQAYKCQIYEGDIVGLSDECWTVEWNHESDQTGINIGLDDSVILFGNIYEHPHLLTNER
jgi:hypothetical protein